MKYNEKDGVKYITFDIFEKYKDSVNAVFSTKIGGVSKGYFSTMNFSFTRGDETACVNENYKRFCKACNLTLDNIVMSDQVHESDIYVVREDDVKNLGTVLENRKLSKIDGMITNVKNVPLFTYYADCVPLFFYDPVKKAVGMSHSGWRGTQKGIGIKTVEAMVREYNSSKEDIISVIGPSICRKCYEVSKEVIDAFKEAYEGKFDLESVYDTKENGKYQLDLWFLNKKILMLAGLKEENIEIAGECTSCNSDILFSHRVTNGKRGNLSGVIELL